MIPLIDREGYTLYMSKEEIAESVKDMGNPPGTYEFVLSTTDRNDEWTIKMFRASHPRYRFYQIWSKRFHWWLKQKRIEKQFNRINNRGLIWKSTPFVLERPWLKLKGRKAVIINIE
jgi:hypothetical protein